MRPARAAAHACSPVREVVLQHGGRAGHPAAELAEHASERVAVAVALGRQALVGPGELLRTVVEAITQHLAGGRVDGPAVEGLRGVGRSVEVDREHRVVAHDIDDDIGAVVVGVERMEHVARVDLDPLGVGRRAVARHHADARGVVGIPPVRQSAPGRGQVHVEQHRQVEHDHLRFGEAHVVHHHRTADVDLLGADQPTARHR